MQAFTENVREKYVIKRPGMKNDLTDPLVNIEGQPGKIRYLLEMACNEMFGNFTDGFNSKVDMEKVFKLEKCEIGLFNRPAWSLYHNFELLRDASTHLDKTQSSRAHECLMFGNEIMNECYPTYKEPGMV